MVTKYALPFPLANTQGEVLRCNLQPSMDEARSVSGIASCALGLPFDHSKIAESRPGKSIESNVFPSKFLEVASTDKCPFLSFYIFDDKVYVAPYPFVLVAGGDMPVPVYVFIAGSQEFARFEKEFNTLYTLAGEMGTSEQSNFS